MSVLRRRILVSLEGAQNFERHKRSLLDYVRRIPTYLRASARAAQAFYNEVDEGGREANRTLSETEERSGLIATALRKAKGLIAGLFAGAALKGLYEINAGFEQTRISLETMLGSADRADAMLRDIVQFAAETPFEVQGLADNVRFMMAMGFEAEETLPILRQVGDATAALGAGEQGIQRIVRALGQMQQKGKVSAEELNQLAEVGIGGWTYLAEEFDTTIADVQSRAEKGALDTGRAVQAIIAGMGEEFAGGMARQAETAAGALSTLRDLARETVRELTGLTFEEFAQDLRAIRDSLSESRSGGAAAWIREAAVTLRALYRVGRDVTKMLIEWGPTLAGLYVGFQVFQFAAKVVTAYQVAQKAATVATALFNSTIATATTRVAAFNLVSGLNPLVLAAQVLAAAAAAMVIFRKRTDEETSALHRFEAQIRESIAAIREMNGLQLFEQLRDTDRQIEGYSVALKMIQQQMRDIEEGVTTFEDKYETVTGPEGTDVIKVRDAEIERQREMNRLREQEQALIGLIGKAGMERVEVEEQVGESISKQIDFKRAELKTITDLNRELTASEAQRAQALQTEIAALEEVLRKRNEIGSASAADASKPQIVGLDAELKQEIEQLGKDIEEMWQGVIESIEMADVDTEGWDELKDAIKRVEEASASYRHEIDAINAKEAAGLLTAAEAAEERREATADHRAQLTALATEYEDLLAKYPGLAKAVREAFDSAPIEGATESTASLSDQLESVADTARGLLRVADAVSEIDDETRQTLESVVDLADGLSGIIANPGDVGSWIQALGGFVGTLQGLFGETPEARAARIELQREIRDNARALRQNTEALLTAAQIGTGIDPAEEQALRGIISDFAELWENAFDFGTGELDPSNTQDFFNQIADVDALFQQLLDLGVEESIVEQYRQQFENLIGSGVSIQDALYQILYGEGGLANVFGELLSSLGDYADTVEGQIERIRDAQRFLGVEGEDALDQFIQSLLDNVGDLAPEAQDLLEQLLGLDRADFDTDADYQAAVQALVADLYRLGTASGLSFDALEAMLDAILGFAAGVEGVTEDLGGEEPTEIGEAGQPFEFPVRPDEEPGGTADESGMVTGGGILSAAEQFRRAIERMAYLLGRGAITLDDALGQLLDAVRGAAHEADTGLVAGELGAEGTLEGFLQEIEGLDLSTAEGQARLEEIIAIMARLGGVHFGLDPAIFEQMLDQLQDLGGQFEVGLPGDEDDSSEGSAGFSVSRQITQWQANQMLDVLRAILHAIRDGLQVSAPPQPMPPQPMPPALPGPPPSAPLPFSAPTSGYGSAIQTSDGEWTVVQVRRGDLDRLADAVYPGVIRRAGRDLNRGFGHR